MFLIALLTKALTTAAIVLAASFVAERARPFLAALVLALPISTGPAYVILALDHDAGFIAEAALSSLAGNVAIAPAAIAYALLARRGGGLIVSYAAMITAWLAAALAVKAFAWGTVSAVILNLVVFGLATALTWGWRGGEKPARVERRWYDLPLRAAIVVSVVVAVILVSERLGPGATGIAALFPASFSSFILLMHRRLGGPAVASAFVNGMTMIFGFTGFLLALHLFAAQGAVWTGLAVGLAIPVAWSALLLVLSRRAARAAP
ncbi:hypothetical protein [Phreatobacter sp.]|uniref:hypothetical protein n=1 Tax=Phreatobacter sp. TaxID=1966341 RepID=UPI0022BBFD6C|nr:hypothetical protein [Phreatobacter sp.]MCZ8316544.1 hypothetical protein [Phreatobacter sp.]